LPIYDYLCSSCGHRTEVIHGINESGPRFCPNCGAEGTLRKGFTTPAILFKGSGWAKKDRSATRSPSSKRSGADAGSGTTDAASSDAKASTADAGASPSQSSSTSGGD
jgi:putative FmdB family regulatory protein